MGPGRVSTAPGRGWGGGSYCKSGEAEGEAVGSGGGCCLSLGGPPVGPFRGLESSPHALSLETWEENVGLSWQIITVGTPGGELRLGEDLGGDSGLGRPWAVSRKPSTSLSFSKEHLMPRGLPGFRRGGGQQVSRGTRSWQPSLPSTSCSGHLIRSQGAGWGWRGRPKGGAGWGSGGGRGRPQGEVEAAPLLRAPLATHPFSRDKGAVT